MRDIGKNIRDLRLRCGLSQEQLAERLFVTRQTISNYENGRTRPDVEQILCLAETFGTDANSVLYGPPQDVRKKSFILTAAVALGLTAVLWLGYMVLSRQAFTVQAKTYNVLPSFALEHCYLPIALTVSGWTLVQLLSLAIAIKPPKSAYVCRIGDALMVCMLLTVVICGLLIMDACCIRILPDLLRQLFSWATYYMDKLIYAYLLVGVALRLLGLPGFLLRDTAN